MRQLYINFVGKLNNFDTEVSRRNAPFWITGLNKIVGATYNQDNMTDTSKETRSVCACVCFNTGNDEGVIVKVPDNFNNSYFWSLPLYTVTRFLRERQMYSPVYSDYHCSGDTKCYVHLASPNDKFFNAILYFAILKIVPCNLQASVLIKTGLMT